jgi:hypothetical protein
MKIHPYAIILGVAIGIMSLVALRHPIFALMVGLIAILGIDMVMRVSKDWPKKPK